MIARNPVSAYSVLLAMAAELEINKGFHMIYGGESDYRNGKIVIALLIALFSTYPNVNIYY